MSIQVVVVIIAKPGHRADVLQAFNDNVPAVLAEKGCLEYAAYVDAEGYRPPIVSAGPEAIVILEKWESREDLAAHSRAPHIVTYQAKVKDWIESRTVQVLTPTR